MEEFAPFECTVPADRETLGLPRWLSPEATFSPTAAGLRPVEDQSSAFSIEMCKVISWAISQEIAETFHQRDQRPASLAPTQPLPYAPSDRALLPGPSSTYPSLGSENSFWGEEDQLEQDLSEAEGLTPDKPAFTGLFKPSLFKSLLFKAKTTIHMVFRATSEQAAMDLQDPSEGFFDEPAPAEEIIPSPKLFVDVIQHQWSQPSSLAAPRGSDKSLYTVDPFLEELL